MQEETRRDFFKKSFLFLGGAIAAVLAIPSAAYFLSPIWMQKKEDWIELGPISEIPQGLPVKVEFMQRKKDSWRTIEGKQSAWVMTEDGQTFTVFDPRCTHLGCPYHWDAPKKQFLCPCHNAIFDMSGRVLAGPAPRPLDRYQVKVEKNRLYVLPL